MSTLLPQKPSQRVDQALPPHSPSFGDDWGKQDFGRQHSFDKLPLAKRSRLSIDLAPSAPVEVGVLQYRVDDPIPDRADMRLEPCLVMKNDVLRFG